MRSVASILVICALAVGCARRLPEPEVSPDSPLAAIRIGMGMREVERRLGRPTETYSYVTPKVTIPFYFGDDAVEIVTRYEGVGRVVFAASGFASQYPRVIQVEEDPVEPGSDRWR